MSTELIDGDPRRPGGYWLAGRLGAGGQEVVYEAYDLHGRRVAIKVLHGDAGADSSTPAEAGSGSGTCAPVRSWAASPESVTGCARRR
ncbi:hypothetical protein GCM10010466_07480 [Planomonospora alba]|uniref:Protein kinase domain-containing protein n=1 Tax=Planomonospora alba TaxID=161354 RepID=A0ABP6MM03_9ACTN